MVQILVIPRMHFVSLSKPKQQDAEYIVWPCNKNFSFLGQSKGDREMQYTQGKRTASARGILTEAATSLFLAAAGTSAANRKTAVMAAIQVELGVEQF